MTDEIDWHEQWQNFSPCFYDGMSHILLSPYGSPSTLLLKPGSGFGDLSHPTTRLALKLLSQRANGKHVVDIGSGSGILTLASVLLGAKDAIGVEIDPASILHAKENCALNKLSSQVQFIEKDAFAPPSAPLLIVMNMIVSEQKVAWSSLPSLHTLPAEIITTGLLDSQQAAYLELAKSWGWTPVLQEEEEGWVAFVFVR